MAIQKVDLTVSQLVSDLNDGFTWLKKDDLGYGSIEEKYKANPIEIAKIRKHPALKDAETSITIFNIIDDTQLPASTSRNEITRANGTTQQPVVPVVSQTSSVGTTEAADIFANL